MVDSDTANRAVLERAESLEVRAAGDAKRALERELAALHAASFGWALACCRRDPSLAEDVLQDVYFKVLAGRARFGGRASLKTWLFGVIRITAREHRRWALLRFRRAEVASEEADLRPAPDSDLASRQRALHLARALARLPERQREVLHLVFYEELTVAEAAEVMGVSLGTARQHYARGKQALAVMLERSEG